MTEQNLTKEKQAWRRAYLARRQAHVAQRGHLGIRPTVPLTVGELADLAGRGRGLRGAIIAGYQALGSEPTLSALLNGWVMAGGTALVPTPQSMSTGRYEAPLWVTLGPGGVPDRGVPATDSLAGASVILVPGLAFGADGARLGRGAGWYDRALATAPVGCLTLGVCFEDEVVGANLIPMEPHDIPVKGVLTPAGVTLF